MPQRLLVPLFQRPYVWNEENQWAPLWADVVRVAEQRLSQPGSKQFPHFLGAVVLQQTGPDFASMQQWMVIDGQQRLTTLQLLLDSLQSELEAVGATQPARRIETLVANSDAYWSAPEDRFKVWPTNRDRQAFNEVMAAESPIDYSNLQHSGDRLVEGHRYFAEQARKWLQLDGPDALNDRTIAIEHTVRELLQLVVIELTAEENAQEIFETLNARGAQLTAADLIKNFVFQRLLEADANVEAIYESSWREFETAFWETEIMAGRVRYPRSSLFLNHWLISRTGEEVVAREVFFRFKRYADHQVGLPMEQVVGEIYRASKVYRDFIERASTSGYQDHLLSMFSYRSSALESEVLKPVVLYFLDPNLPAIPEDQIALGLSSLESWLVRRMLVRAETKSYSQFVAEIVSHLLKVERNIAGQALFDFLKSQSVVSRYWPSNNEVRQELQQQRVFVTLRRPRLRMVLEAIEDYYRGWINGKAGLGGERVPRGKYAIEHVLPRQWSTNWPLDPGMSADERDRILHTLGNLTLMTGRLNSKASNNDWLQKKEMLKDHDVLLLNRNLLRDVRQEWTHDEIRLRTDRMISAILDIWPAPEGHTTSFGRPEERPRSKIEITDLIAANLLRPGDHLFSPRKVDKDKVVTVLADGKLEVDGNVFATPSGAAAHFVGPNRSGWTFFIVDKNSRKKLNDLVYEYVDMTSADVDESELQDDEDELDEN